MEVSLYLFYIYLSICFLYLVLPRMPAPGVFLNCITAASAMSYGAARFIERFWWGYEQAKDKVISPLPNRDTAFISPYTQQTPTSFYPILSAPPIRIATSYTTCIEWHTTEEVGESIKEKIHYTAAPVCSVIHPRACSAPKSFIYRVLLQQ